MMAEQQTQSSYDFMSALRQDDFSRYLLDPSDLLEAISHTLKGEIKMDVVEKHNGREIMVTRWIKPSGVIPPINEKGYHYVMQLLTPAMSKVVSSSNISEEKSLELVNDIINQITTTFYYNYNQQIQGYDDGFDFPDQNILDSTIVTLCHLIMFQFFRPVGMETLKQIHSQHQIVEQRLYDKSKDKIQPSMSI